MEEKIIIKSEKPNYTKIALIWLAVTAVITLILCLSIVVPIYNRGLNWHNNRYDGYYYSRYSCPWCSEGTTAAQCAFGQALVPFCLTLILPIGASVLFFALFFLLTYFCNIIQDTFHQIQHEFRQR